MAILYPGAGRRRRSNKLPPGVQPTDEFEKQLRLAGVETPTKEFLFAFPRKFAFDYCWPTIKLAVEIEGGTWINGGHNRGVGYRANCEKYNLAARLGWMILRYTTDMVADESAILEVIEALAERRHEMRRTS